MKSKLRTFAWACITAGASLATQAGTVTVDFDALGLQAGSAGIALTDQYHAQGLSFSGGLAGNALAFHNGAENGNLNRVPCRPVTCNQPNGFLGNDGGSFTMTVDADRSFTGLLLDYAVGPKGFQFTVFSRPDANNVTKSATRKIDGTGAGWSGWTSGLDPLNVLADNKSTASLTGADFGAIDKIVFTASLAFFALDNLVFTESNGGSGTVPEPASFGLVALALAATGLAYRRRRQHGVS